MVTEITAAGADLWPWPPNWRDTYTMTFEFKTDIFTSRSRREQRRAQRTTARRRVEFTLTANADRLRAIDRFIYGHLRSLILLPDLLRSTTTAAIASAATVITVTSVPNWLVAGQDFILVNGDTSAHYLVLSIAGAAVTLNSPTAEAWPAGTLMHPALLGNTPASLPGSSTTDDVGEVSFSVAVRPGIGIPYSPGTAGTVFQGREIFPLAPNRSTPVSASFGQYFDSVDFARGRIENFYPADFGSRVRQLQFLLPTQADIATLVAFFCRMKGQRGEFYLSTDQQDIVIAAPVSSSGVTLTVPGTDLAAAYGSDTVHRAIQVRGHDGQTYPHAINTIVSSGGNSVITLATGLAIDITAANKISWLLAHRFAVDMLTIAAVTNGVATTSLAVTSLEDLPVP